MSLEERDSAAGPIRLAELVAAAIGRQEFREIGVATKLRRGRPHKWFGGPLNGAAKGLLREVGFAIGLAAGHLMNLGDKWRGWRHRRRK